MQPAGTGRPALLALAVLESPSSGLNVALIKMPVRPAARSFLQRLPSRVLSLTRRGHHSTPRQPPAAATPAPVSARAPLSASSPPPPPRGPRKPPPASGDGDDDKDSTLSARPGVSCPLVRPHNAGSGPAVSPRRVHSGDRGGAPLLFSAEVATAAAAAAAAAGSGDPGERDAAATTCLLSATASSKSATFA